MRQEVVQWLRAGCLRYQKVVGPLRAGHIGQSAAQGDSQRDEGVNELLVRDQGSVIELFKEFQTTHVVEEGEVASR